ncbi:Enoyl-CoA hydratase/isomerase [Caldalkalibacillus thermarum TA2.A1]|uniref:Enoyl-CoA hydratase/isomerase n=1 Tax=Caldalkalibacillus thermarum (strain TA2.A1) TaxID=986075 RepID=F5L6I8_CALTT|nr:enoyl-CoA hydratase-related protein [Caldalkalibacillus thermarum]EGL83049.1 Enoyl-CoA hydratase/isomerase [Caldalkalibacillus thermarum TA2.A1]QZT33558.1 enoyl-CoA hydratase/isomerase family protein [Caldalkalibacillus thermarum TA2.A1]
METIRFEVQDKIATITFNRPRVLNAFNLELHEEFYHALSTAREDEAVRCIVLRGEGRAFSAGADLKAMQERDETVDVGDYLRQTYNRTIKLMTEIEKPVVATVHGPAHGAGLGVALAADFRIASESANFCLAFIKIGLMPDAGTHYFLPRLIGLGRALELAASGETIDAKQAYAMGLVNRVVSDDRLEEETIQLATQLASMPTKAFGYMKKTMLSSFESDLSTVLEAEAQGQSILANTEDHREGVAAFYEKRKPVFKGR